MGNQMILVLGIFGSFLHRERVSIYIQHLQVLEFCFFLCSFTEICDYFLKTFYLVIPDRENVQFGTILKSPEGGNLVIVKWDIGEVDEAVESFDFLDVVEGEIKPLEVNEMTDVLYFFDDIVI